MSLVPSLLQAIVRVDGEALVMHVGEKPYVVSPNGQVDLATRGLTFEAVSGIVAQLLPPDALKSLEDVGATQFELPTFDEFPGEHFTVTAARGGDDVWAEIRRRQLPDEDLVPPDLFAAASPAPVVDVGSDALELPKEHQLWPSQMPAAGPIVTPDDDDLTVTIPEPEPVAPPVTEPLIPAAPLIAAKVPEPIADAIPDIIPELVAEEPTIQVSAVIEDAGSVAAESSNVVVEEPSAAPLMPITADAPAPSFAEEPHAVEEGPVEERPVEEPPVEELRIPELAAAGPALAESVAQAADLFPFVESESFDGKELEVVEESMASEPPAAGEPDLASFAHATERLASSPSVPEFTTQAASALSEAHAAAQLSEAVMSTLPSEFSNFLAREPQTSPSPAGAVEPPAAAFGGAVPEPRLSAPDAHAASSFVPFPPLAEPPQPAVVLPIGRGNGREVGMTSSDTGLVTLERLVRMAASRGASALYLSTNARPAARLDGDIQTLDLTAVHSAQDIELLLAEALADRGANPFGMGAPSEWVWDLADVGRIRCTSFRDHRGPGAVLRIVSVRPQSASQLGLSREIQALASDTEGLILVSGPRANGKSTLISSFVDLINRTRRDYVITIESEINIVHERQGAFISQREVRGGSDEVLAAARAALREEPDVLVLEDLRTSALMSLALDAAAAGQLIIGGVPAHHATGAIDRLIELYQPDQRRQAQLSLAQNLRGVVTQVLLRKSGGGRVAAREVLLNTPLVASLLAEGRTAQLAVAIEGGRKNGMVPLNDALVGFVQSGVVDVREAYRRASDRAGLLDLLKRQGIDTSFTERLA